jgi:aromatic ring-opening dioxygenase catalytic subunit (LigB family)
MTKSNMILHYVKIHAKYWQDDYYDYPSFIYHVTYNGNGYTARSYEDLVTMIMKDSEEL